jgi:pilus assembly protein CpaF
MSYDLILPFFPEELRALLLALSISNLMINGRLASTRIVAA